MIESMSELKDVPGYEGLYGVTRDGRVWSYNLKRFLKFSPNLNGHHCVSLYNVGVRKGYSIHRLVMSAYKDLDLDDSQMVVHHIDGNKSNNHIKNLQIISDYEHRCNHKKGYGRNTETHKLCTCCGILKLRNEFYVSRNQLDGLHSWCKFCCEEYYQRNKEAILKKKKEEYDLRLSAKKQIT